MNNLRTIVVALAVLALAGCDRSQPDTTLAPTPTQAAGTAGAEFGLLAGLSLGAPIPLEPGTPVPLYGVITTNPLDADCLGVGRPGGGVLGFGGHRTFMFNAPARTCTRPRTGSNAAIIIFPELRPFAPNERYPHGGLAYLGSLRFGDCLVFPAPDVNGRIRQPEPGEVFAPLAYTCTR